MLKNPKGAPFVFFGIVRFFGKKLLDGPPSIFRCFATEWMLKNPKGSPFSFFSALRLSKDSSGAVEEYTLTL